MATYQESPQWVRAADSHNVAAHNSSAFEEEGKGEEEQGFFAGLGESLSNTPEFLQVSAASGINSFYNTGVTLSNVFRDEDNKLDQNNTGEWISDYDEDLGKYYKENKSAADITGFIAGSFIPGIGGIKILSAGQKALRVAARGNVGANFTRATGLLAPNMQMHVRKGAAELASRSGQWSMFNANSLKHIRNNTWQGLLEGVAFEGAVMATMFKAPLFDDMDGWDMAKMMGVGVALGGGVGTVIGGASSYFRTTGLLKQSDARQLAFSTGRFTVGPRTAEKTSDNITAAAFDRDRLLKPVTYEDVVAMKGIQETPSQRVITQFSTVEEINAEVQHLNRLRVQNLDAIGNELRTSIHTLHKTSKAKADNGFMANNVADVLAPLEARGVYNTFDNLNFFGRLVDDSNFQNRVKDIMRQAKKEGITLTKAEAQTKAGKDTTSYLQLHSGEIGGVSAVDPASAARLADSMSPSQIKDYVKSNKFSLGKVFNMTDKANPKVAEARWLWARELKKPLSKKVSVHAYDLPLLEKAVRDGNSSLTVALPNGNISQLSTADEISKFYRDAQRKVGTHLRTRKGMTTDKMEVITNIRRDWIEGAPRYDITDPKSFDAQSSYASELATHLDKEVTPASLHYRPKYMKASYNDPLTDESGNILRGMQAVEYGNKLYQEGADRAAAYALGPMSEGFQTYGKELMSRVWRGGVGQGVVRNAGGGYDTLESVTSANANLLAELEKKLMSQLKEDITPHLTTLLSDSPTAVRFSLLNEQLAGMQEKFVLRVGDDGIGELIPRKLKDYEDELELFAQGGRTTEPTLPTLEQGTPESIPLTEKLTGIVDFHIQTSAIRGDKLNALTTAQGNASRTYADTYYPVRQDPRQFKNFAFVVDNKISGVGHKRMVLARTGEELEQQLKKVPSEYKIVRKGESEDYHKALGDYLYDRTLHENYLDIDLTAKGIRSNFFPHTDPQTIADTFLQHHIRGENALIREGVATKFAPFINEMEKLGKLYAETQASSTENISRLAVSTKRNPYMAQVKGLFNISRLEDAPDWWLTANRSLDKVVSQAWNKVDAALQGRKGRIVDDSTINEINSIMDDVGFKSAYYDAATNILANSKIDQGVLSKFVRTSNAFLTATILRLDPFNALNNKLGNQIIMSAEVQSLLQGIKKRDPEAAGRLANLTDVTVPGTGGDGIFSAYKVIGQAYADVLGPDKAAILARYKERGLVPDLASQLLKGLDSMTLSGADTAVNVSKKTEQIKATLGSLAEKGSKVTGNDLSERLNRVVAARVMEKFTDAAIQSGVIREGEQWSFINTFVNRVNGAVRAAERPLMFQGPIGQAMGLFQSYQFNLIQQSLRHIGEGRAKTMAIMAGMQTSIYGGSSLPGFSAINNSLVGNAAGNKGHQDLFSISQAVLGKEGAEWLMYGAPSNILNSALYSRGNTNPRVWHIVPNPTNPTDLPFIGAYGRALGSLKGAITSVKEGAPVWESILRGLEHSGLSRPLAGIAASARGLTNDGVAFTTQRSGNFVYENDLMSLTTLARIAGAKPLDEAIMQNNFFQNQSYAASDRQSRNKIGEALRTTIQAGGVPDTEALNGFAEKYVARGGNQKNFNQYFMDQYKNATTSQAEQLSRNLSNPYGRKMQYLLGGSDSGIGFADIYPQ